MHSYFYFSWKFTFHLAHSRSATISNMVVWRRWLGLFLFNHKYISQIIKQITVWKVRIPIFFIINNKILITWKVYVSLNTNYIENYFRGAGLHCNSCPRNKHHSHHHSWRLLPNYIRSVIVYILFSLCNYHYK